MLAQGQQIPLYSFSADMRHPLSAMCRGNILTITMGQTARNTRRKVRDSSMHASCLPPQALLLIFLGGFLTPFWRNTVFLSILLTGFYKFAPAPGEELFLTQYLAQFKTSQEVWASINEKHVLDVTTQSEGLLLQASAERPKAHRYRYPQ